MRHPDATGGLSHHAIKFWKFRAWLVDKDFPIGRDADFGLVQLEPKIR